MKAVTLNLKTLYLIVDMFHFRKHVIYIILTVLFRMIQENIARARQILHESETIAIFF